jgi:hypothetical protein
MSRKTLIWIFLTVGSYVGSWIPSLWDAGAFSMSGVFLGALGGILGIWLAFKLSE